MNKVKPESQHTKTGRIFLIGTWNNGKDHENDLIRCTAIDTRRIFLLHSDDDGRTWSAPREITRETKQNDWGWVATGPGHGIQLQLSSNHLFFKSLQ